MKPEFENIHHSALLAASHFRKAEKQLVDALVKVDQCSLFLHLGFPSLFQYTFSSLGLSEATAYNFMAVARKAREVPELKEEIVSLGVSKARKIISVLTPENQSEWILKAKTLSTRALEKEVARVNPRSSTPEKATYVSEKRLDLQLGISEERLVQLRRAQDQVSQNLGRAVSLEETLEQVVSFYLKRKDPLEKARRVIAKKGTAIVHKLFTGTVGQRQPIPKSIQHQVRLRDQNQCQAPKTGGGVCGSKRWIDIHHQIPVSQGGENTTENLITLCRQHHRLRHQ